MRTSLLLLLGTGCVEMLTENPIKTDTDLDTDTGTPVVQQVDADGDGYIGASTGGDDCNDSDAAIYPSATEICDGIDNDCDDSVDEDVKTIYYADVDLDGYGDVNVQTEACDVPSGYVVDNSDCDDTNANRYPGNVESCDSVDNDCDGDVDENAGAWYQDDDNDGFGNAAVTLDYCDGADGYVADATDCDDTVASTNPAAAESCDSVDNDCDGEIDEDVKTTYYADSDEDGFGDLSSTTEACSLPSGYAENASDCDDATATTFPGADETCNGLDDDCDGTVDEDSAVDAGTWYNDADGDGYGDISTTAVSCIMPPGMTTDSNDCDDADADVNPAAEEVCNGTDDDCDGVTDPDSSADAATWYADSDSDGYGDAATSTVSCSAPSGYVADATDCDDTDADVSPADAEYCNEIDDDCDGTIDEDDAVDATTFYADLDGDTYGDAGNTHDACGQPDGYVLDLSDCDDLDSSVNPGEDEVCDGVNDENCDGTVDEDSAVDATEWYPDGDGDGYGNGTMPAIPSCEPLIGFADNGGDSEDFCSDVNGEDHTDLDFDGYTACDGDCDESDDDVYPGASEVNSLGFPDGVDNDCDGVADNNTDYFDDDGDGYTEDDGDCDDTELTVSPSATEVCGDSIDNNCDGEVDEDSADGAITWYLDADGDGYGDSVLSALSCSEPSGYVQNADDCDDTTGAVSPADNESCNGVDDNCDGAIDEDSVCDDVDQDGDGVTGAIDCDDTDPTASPLGDEGANCADNVDNDCDGAKDLLDEDCSDESDDDLDGKAEIDGDCDDGNSDVYDGAPEVEDGLDNDCDGLVDEGTEAYDDDGDGMTDTDGDCNDADATIYTGATEACDYVDQDCDDSVDEDAGCSYVDDDEDGMLDSLDCDDTDAAVNPLADEVCADAIDNDCDGLVDDGSAVDATVWYEDTDGDGYGDTDTVSACDQPSGNVATPGDCDDDDATVNPDATEVCNSVDDNCDGAVDEEDVCPAPDTGDSGTDTGIDTADTGTVDTDTRPACTDDVDEDGAISDACEGGTDCDDNADNVNTSAIEACSNLDMDCDGIAGIDDLDAVCETWITCTISGDMVINFQVEDVDANPATDANPWQEIGFVPTQVNFWGWDIRADVAVGSVSYVGDGTEHSITIPASSFTPEGQSATSTLSWAELRYWYVDETGTDVNAAGDPICEIIIYPGANGDGVGADLYVVYNP